MEKQRWEESEKLRRKRSEKGKSQKKGDAGAREGRKVAIHCVFPESFLWLRKVKVGSLQRRVRSHLGRWEMKNCTVKMYKARHCWSTFGSWCWKSARCCGAKHMSKSKCTKRAILGSLGSWDVPKVHAVVAQSIFWSQNVQNTPFSEYLWKWRCWKSARRGGAKQISKSKC